jgi:hypothetical protein
MKDAVSTIFGMKYLQQDEGRKVIQGELAQQRAERTHKAPIL